jgi:hypothetical protein
MTLLEMKNKVLRLIEEANPNNENLTDDPDIAMKINDVINQVLYELARFKKIPRYFEFEVTKGELIDFERLEKECGSAILQLSKVSGIEFEYKADNTIIKCLEDGTLEIEYYKYPLRIDDTTTDEYEFELSDDVLEILPYGVAADVLKSDVSNAYGNVYAERYEQMKQQLDIRYNTGSIEFEGGINI